MHNTLPARTFTLLRGSSNLVPYKNSCRVGTMEVLLFKSCSTLLGLTPVLFQSQPCLLRLQVANLSSWFFLLIFLWTRSPSMSTRKPNSAVRRWGPCWAVEGHDPSRRTGAHGDTGSETPPPGSKSFFWHHEQTISYLCFRWSTPHDIGAQSRHVKVHQTVDVGVVIHRVLEFHHSMRLHDAGPLSNSDIVNT